MITILGHMVPRSYTMGVVARFINDRNPVYNKLRIRCSTGTRGRRHRMMCILYSKYAPGNHIRCFPHHTFSLQITTAVLCLLFRKYIWSKHSTEMSIGWSAYAVFVDFENILGNLLHLNIGLSYYWKCVRVGTLWLQ